MPNDIHDKWMQEALGVKIGYPRPVPDDEDRPQKGKVEFGPPEIERPLGEPVYGPKADTLYAFLNDKGGLIDSSFAPTAVKLNEEGAAVQALFRAISKRQIEWNNKIGGIQKNAGKGKDELKQLQNAAAAIGDHARGPEGQYMREAIEAYRDAVKKAEGQVGEIGLKMKAYEIATADLGVQKLEGKVVVADRNVKEGEETVRVEEKRVEEEKKKIEKKFSKSRFTCSSRIIGPDSPAPPSLVSASKCSKTISFRPSTSMNCAKNSPRPRKNSHRSKI